MKEETKRIITEMRAARFSYEEIEARVQIPLATIKTFCYRNNLHDSGLAKLKGVCIQCGKPIYSDNITRARKFCSIACKNNWWNRHRQHPNSKRITEHTCATCGKTFLDYSSAKRRYCSYECYWTRGKRG